MQTIRLHIEKENENGEVVASLDSEFEGEYAELLEEYVGIGSTGQSNNSVVQAVDD